MDYSILVNKDNKIKKNYFEKLELIKALDIEKEEVEVEKTTYNAYLQLKNFLLNKGVEIGIASSYRSIEHQQQVYDDFVIKYGKEYADKYVATPGYSEHHTGLCIDIEIKTNGVFFNDNDFIMEHKDIYENIHKYFKQFGFILRYPEGKEYITGYPYEPWHIRYVGKFIANIITDNNLTLEEYKTCYSAIMVINKHKGCTSFDIVNEVSKLFGIKKVGHTGTLDPMAEGILIICIGQATKIVELLTAKEKEYIATAKLGITTDTYDIEGKITKSHDIPSNLDLKSILTSFKKTYLQEVPIYSAVKVKGKKLYEYARQNKKVELPKKEVTIKNIELLSSNNDILTFKALVSKGCYIRSLINDIGKSIGCGATMTSLIRTKQGLVTLDCANEIEDVRKGIYKLYSVEDMLEYETIVVDSELENYIKNGVKIDNKWKIKDKVIFKNSKGNILGIYEVDNHKLKVWKNFNCLN